MTAENEQLFPLGKLFGLLTKQYISILSAKLENIPLKRYYYPFWLIAENNKSITQQNLSKHLQVDKVVVVRIVDYLENEGFIKRLPNPEDRRSHLLEITKKGEPYVEVIENAIKDTDQLFLENMGQGKKSLFSQELIQLANKMETVKGHRIALFYDNIKNN
ncbi:MAG: MarR family transcriptional regulator [Brumimicrobium sp.]